MSSRAIIKNAFAAVVFLSAGSVLQPSAKAQVASPTQLQFAAQPAGTRSSAQTITVTNNTAGPVQIGAILLYGPDATSYGAKNPCFLQQLSPGGNCSVSFTSAPLHTGATTATAEIAVGTSVVTISLAGSGTGTNPTYAVPTYQATVLDNFPAGAQAVSYVLGFNNRDEFVGWLEYPGYGCVNDTGGDTYSVPFSYSSGSYTDLTALPGSLVVSPHACQDGWGWASGIDDAGEVFGINFSVPNPASAYKYDGTTWSFIGTPGQFLPRPVFPNGLALLSTLPPNPYYFNGQIAYPQALSYGGFAGDLFDVPSLSLIPSRSIPRINGCSGENAQGIAHCNTSFGDNNLAPALFQSGVATVVASSYPGQPVVGDPYLNAAGLTIIQGYSADNAAGTWDLRTGAIRTLPSLPSNYFFSGGGVYINDTGHILLLASKVNTNWFFPIILTPVLTTPVGNNVIAQSGSTSLTFSTIISPGTTTVTPIDASTTGTVPGGFAISDTLAYQINTTATFSGPVTVGFVVPGPISEADFNTLRVLHNQNGSLVDITTGYDYSRMTIYATTTSFSPFYLARTGTHVVPLFDATKAYKAGSTIPIKLQVLNAGNANISSASLNVKARKVIRLQDSTATSVIDSGNANPDSDFRFDAATGGYIFNLSTKNMSSGRYSLSLYVGADKQYVYSVSFELK
jgi:hypothetical protein